MTFEENIGELCIINGETVPSERLNLYTNDKYIAFYEVIRIINGIPLFYNNHFSRLKSSMSKSNYELNITEKELKGQIQKVCEINKLSDCNIKVIVLQYEDEQIVLAFVNKFYYPSEKEYNDGVACCTVILTRNNPNIKMIHMDYKEEIKRAAQEKSVFEVLLVNDEGKITEGGKSNAFFVKEDKIYTAPEEYILKGITRQYVIEACRDQGYEVIETLVDTEMLTGFDAVFITGTSINVLPVRTIDNHVVNSARNITTQHVMEGYKNIVKKYLNDN